MQNGHAQKELKNLEYGQKIALIGLVEFFLLAVLKGSVGLATGMVVLVADALSSSTDMLSIFASYLGLRISKKCATRKFSYGYYKVESLTALFVSMVILYLGIIIFLESASRFQSISEVTNPFLGVITVVVSAISSFHLSKMFRSAGKKINSLSLVNSGKDTTIDIFVQIVVLIGVGGSWLQIPYVEGIVGMIVSLITLKVGFSATKESLFFLLDYFDNPKLIKEIRSTIQSRATIVEDIKGIKMRRAGTFLFGEAILEMSPYVDAKDIRTELEKLKRSIYGLNPYIKDFALLIDIPHPRVMKIAVPAQDQNGLESTVAKTMEDTKAYVFVKIQDEKIVDCTSRAFSPRGKKYRDIIEFLKEQNTEVVVNNRMDSLLYYHIRHLEKMLVYPNFDNVKYVKNTVKVLLLDM